MSTYLTRRPLDGNALIAAVSGPERGGVATFLGLVRNHHGGRGVLRLEYSAYESMAEVEASRIVAEAEARWPVRVALLHRLGNLAIGDAAVIAAAGSAHRAQAFEACQYVIEEMKRRVPIWKKEFYTDGSVGWVDPTAAEPARQPAGSDTFEVGAKR
jgi:molybdopterin synthase catalytic subunit